jgi:hypothetical protein
VLHENVLAYRNRQNRHRLKQGRKAEELLSANGANSVVDSTDRVEQQTAKAV